MIVVDTEAAPAPTEFHVEVSIAGGRITTGAFAATLEFSGDLFTSGITVRVVARGATTGARSLASCPARATTRRPGPWNCGPTDLRHAHVPGDGNLERDRTVEIEVLDARTGLRLGGTEASLSTRSWWMISDGGFS